MGPKPSCLDGGSIPSTPSPIVEQQKNNINTTRFFILQRKDVFSNVSPFLIEKAIAASVGSVKMIRKMHSGDLLLEMPSAKQVPALMNLSQFPHFDGTVVPQS
ncbi:hypothetical protein NPIL_158671 [Nephila pilipes]|uniref:Uncharacterized protein n=1 Tax=Nephila pilipes TaxID=299642 RepID=A0A8X6U3W3_NEPPI|nr:hypothetical protein NPIL_158671 [Nephila pilipes]